MSSATFGPLPWRSRSQHDLAAKLCPANNFAIWSQFLQLFHRNDHNIEMTRRAQHLGHYLECQGHSMTLLQNRIRPITLLFEVGFRKYFTEMITILRRCVARNIWDATFEGQGHSMTLHQNRVRPITFLFEVGFRKYFTEMITILRRRVACNIWVTTLNVKVTVWPFRKIVSGPKLCYLGRILQLLLTNYFSVSNTYSGSITRFRLALVYLI